MPANLPPQYFAAEKQYRSAKTIAEKVEALHTMLSVMPKHKGTDKLRADLRSRIAKLTAQSDKARATGRRGSGYSIPREGAGQVALVGLPNVGKSQLLTALTGAVSQVADYPFTTRYPTVGMMPFKDIQIQLIDLPPITDAEAHAWLPTLLRNADLLVLVIHHGYDCAAQVDAILGKLEQMKASPGDADVLDIMSTTQKALILINKSDLDPARDSDGQLQSRYGSHFPIIFVSARTGGGLEDFKRKLYETLQIIRVYTKAPGKKADFSQPVTIPQGSTVADAAGSIHKDFRKDLKRARIWGSGKFNGQMVKKDYVLQDGDIVEFHI